jgi:hypothetical protein
MQCRSVRRRVRLSFLSIRGGRLRAARGQPPRVAYETAPSKKQSHKGWFDCPPCLSASRLHGHQATSGEATHVHKRISVPPQSERHTEQRLPNSLNYCDFLREEIIALARRDGGEKEGDYNDGESGRVSAVVHM